ncbi:MAG: aminotransferase class V-fold PLP-dependent enzyme [Pseudomonadota bacterium]
MTGAPHIYLNACSHGLPDVSCAQAVSRQALRPPGLADEEAELRDRARLACATLLGAEAADVGLGGGTFQLWAAGMERLPNRPGRILIAAHEWGDHVRWLRRLAARGEVALDVVPAEGGEAFDPAAWAARMDEDVLAMFLPFVTSVGGLRYPAREIAALDRPENALVVLDVAQAFGRVLVEPHDLGCDVVVGTARKWLRGPRQTAMIWFSERAERVLQCKARDIEPNDLNAALVAGLVRAVELAVARGIPAISEHIARLDDLLRAGLADIAFIEMKSAGTVGTVSCSVRPDAKPALDARLRASGIVAKWCDAARDEPLSDVRSGTTRLRFSPHVYNGESDIMTTVEAVGTRRGKPREP